MDAIATPVDASVGRPAADGRVASLFDRHYERLYRLARRLTPSADEALDLVQETFLKVAAAPSAVPTAETAEKAYLIRALVNLRKDQWRKSRVRARYVERASPVSSSEGPGDRVIAQTDVWRALDTLAPRRRAVVVLHELDGLSAGEVARLIGISAVTVRWHLFQARRELAAACGVKARTR